jgi:integrase
MPISWDKRNKCWRYFFDRYIQGNRHRASRLLPRGWSQAEADAFDRTESARLYAVACGIQDDDPLIETAVALYLNDKTALKSFKTAAEHLAAIFPAYAGKRMSALQDVSKEVAAKRAREDGKGTLSDATIKQRLALLKAACRWAWKRHRLTKHDPTQQMALPSVRNERHDYRGRREMLLACRACTNWGAQVAIRVAFYTGMRLGEILRARPDGGVLILEDTKNGDRRAVPIHPKIAHLARFLPLPGPKITIQRAWERARGAVGLHGVRFHDLRHWAASEMVNNGVRIEVVAAVLGHRDLRTTKNRYAHLNVDTMAEAIGVIGKKQA